MSWASVFASRLQGLFRTKRVERELDEEVRFHLEMQMEDSGQAMEAELAVSTIRGLFPTHRMRRFPARSTPSCVAPALAITIHHRTSRSEAHPRDRIAGADRGGEGNNRISREVRLPL